MYPVLFTIGPLTVYSFGVFLIMALLCGLFLFWLQAKETTDDTEFIFDVALVGVVSGLLGARFLYALLHTRQFWPKLYNIFNVFGLPGFVYYGGIVGAIIGIVWFCRKQGKAAREYLDMAAVSTSVAHSIGLLGAFLSATAYGAKTQMPWGVFMAGLEGRRHPVQLVELFFELAIFLFLFYKAKKQRRAGTLAFYYVVLYAVARIVVEFLRGDSVYWFGIKTQWILSSIVIVLAFVYAYKRQLLPTAVFKKQRPVARQMVHGQLDTEAASDRQ